MSENSFISELNFQSFENYFSSFHIFQSGEEIRSMCEDSVKEMFPGVFNFINMKKEEETKVNESKDCSTLNNPKKKTNEESSSILEKSSNLCLEENIVKFKTLLYKKRGRKIITEKKNRKCHSGNDFDNIKRSIQVKFFSFLIGLANDAIHSILGPKTNFKFLKINYNDKQEIKEQYLKSIKNYSYSDILKLKISCKYKNFNEDHNEKTFQEINAKSPILKKFFEQNYLTVFKKYFFNNKKELKEFFFEEKKIILSPSTKGLYFFLKDDDKKKILLRTVKKVYFQEENNNIFKIENEDLFN